LGKDEGDVDQNHQDIYLFLLNQEWGFDGGRLRYWRVGHLPFRWVFCEKSGRKIFDGFDQHPTKEKVSKVLGFNLILKRLRV